MYQPSDYVEIVACHHDNGVVSQVKFDTGTIVSMKEAINIAKEGKIKNFSVSYDNRRGKQVLRGKRETLPNARLYDLPRF